MNVETIEQAKAWVRDAGDSIDFDRCVGKSESDQLKYEVEQVCSLLDELDTLRRANDFT